MGGETVFFSFFLCLFPVVFVDRVFTLPKYPSTKIPQKVVGGFAEQCLFDACVCDLGKYLAVVSVWSELRCSRAFYNNFPFFWLICLRLEK